MVKIFNVLVFFGLCREFYIPLYFHLFKNNPLPQPVNIFICLLVLNSLIILFGKKWRNCREGEADKFDISSRDATGCALPALFMIGFFLLIIIHNYSLFSVFLISYMTLAAAASKIIDDGRDDYHHENTGDNTVIILLFILTLVWTMVVMAKVAH